MFMWMLVFLPLNLTKTAETGYGVISKSRHTHTQKAERLIQCTDTVRILFIPEKWNVLRLRLSWKGIVYRPETLYVQVLGLTYSSSSVQVLETSGVDTSLEECVPGLPDSDTCSGGLQKQTRSRSLTSVTGTPMNFDCDTRNHRKVTENSFQ